MESEKRGLLIVLSGPSGVGKGTICQELVGSTDSIAYSVSVTTREKRPGEVEGKDYFFVSDEEFVRMAREGEFLEYTRVFGKNSYGTPKKYVMEQLERGLDVILEIDVQGGLHVRQELPEAVLVFIAPPNMQELKKRLIDRGTENEEDICKRTETAYQEMLCISFYDYLVVNSTVQEAVNGVRSILCAEHARVSRNENLMNILLGRT